MSEKHKLNGELQEYIVRAMGAVASIVGAGATLGGGFDDLRLRLRCRKAKQIQEHNFNAP